MKKFVSWLGGIVAAVIAGVLVYKLTVTPTPPPPPPEITFEGMVIDGERFIALKDVLVSLEVNGTSPTDAYHDLTDQNGSYGIKLTGLDKTSKVRVVFHANGYNDDSKQYAAVGDDNRYDPLMKSIPTPPPPHGDPTPSPVTTNRVAPQYVQKVAMKTFIFAQKK